MGAQINKEMMLRASTFLLYEAWGHYMPIFCGLHYGFSGEAPLSLGTTSPHYF